MLGSLLALAAMLWFGIAYSMSTQYGYFWFLVLLMYLVPSAFGMLATQLSMEVSGTNNGCHIQITFNMKKSCWWCCLCCFPYKPTLARAFTSLGMMTSAIGLVQLSWQVKTPRNSV
jgi:hypothetical protein